MNKKNEEKLLKEFIRLIDDPEKTEKKFLNFARIGMLISVLFVFYCLSANFETIENKIYFALMAFVSGVAFGMSLWFIQAGTQTRVMAKHMSRESINRRIEEINL